MGEQTGIEWCHHTFNPWIGCTKVSPGCAHCYAEVDTPARLARNEGRELWGKDGDRKVKAESGWADPLKWARAAWKVGERRRVFCASQGDCLELRDDLAVPRARLLDLIDRTPNLDWLLLTKRPENWREAMLAAARLANGSASALARDWLDGKPPANVWLGVSVEDQQRANERVPKLLETPAALRFLSVEPLLGPIDLADLTCRYGGPYLDALRGIVEKPGQYLSSDRYPPLDWVIAGGESGPKARRCEAAWVNDVAVQCRAAKVPVFIKQLGSRSSLGPLRDKKGGDPAEWPPGLRVREFPKETDQ
jgi:protein gp37